MTITRLRARRAVEEVVARARVAEDEVAGWADEVRREAEARLEIGRDDERAWGDPAYAMALDTYGGLCAARERIEGVLAALAAEKEG